MLEGDLNLEWYDKAECANEDPELFFPHQEELKANAEKAKAVCRRCQVMEECLQWALDTNQNIGIWGGMSASERSYFKKNYLDANN
jgi:WhiB family redox-sensing transcriptional regulator